jgi:hypothetical protein
MEQPNDKALSAAPWEPWRCSVCGLYVYNLDDEGYPASGAPSPRYISQTFPIVCSVCWTLYVTIDRSEYFAKLSRMDNISDEEKLRRIRRLRPGGEYLQ